MHDEGVIKFEAVHQGRAIEPSVKELCFELIAWRELLAKTQLVGQREGLYGGFAYGNVSARLPPFGEAGRGRRRFVITGTQTSGDPCASPKSFCVVSRYEPQHNRVHSHGEVLPSSEAMTHGAIYDLSPHWRFVFHAHSKWIWSRAKQLSLPTTAADVPYGTPRMTREVERLYTQSTLAERRIFAMAGHEDGVVAFGKTAAEAGEVLFSTLAQAYAQACKDQGELCR